MKLSKRAATLLRRHFLTDDGKHISGSAVDTDEGRPVDWLTLENAGYVRKHTKTGRGIMGHNYSYAITPQGEKYLKGELQPAKETAKNFRPDELARLETNARATVQEHCQQPAPFRVQIDFADAEDLLRFTGYVAKAKEQDGTVTGVYAGVMCSALKRAKVTPVPQAPPAQKGIAGAEPQPTKLAALVQAYERMPNRGAVLHIDDKGAISNGHVVIVSFRDKRSAMKALIEYGFNPQGDGWKLGEPTIFATVLKHGFKYSNHESDLYLPDTEEVRAMLAQFPKTSYTQFNNQVEGGVWLDIPFHHTPTWVRKISGPEI